MAKPLKTKTSRRKDRAEQKKLTVSPETIAQHSLLLGRAWHHTDTAQADVLGIIHDRGYITSDQRDTGRDFGALYNRFFPVHERAASIGTMAGNGSIGMPADFKDAEDEIKYARYRTLIRLLSIERDYVIEVAACDIRPDWLDRVIQAETAKIKEIERWRKHTLNSFMPTKDKSILQQNLAVHKEADRMIANIRDYVEKSCDRRIGLLRDGLDILNGKRR